MPLHRLKRMIAVSCDPFVYAEQYEIQSPLVAIIKRFEDRCKNGAVFTTRGTYGYLLARLEEVGRGDRFRDLGFEKGDEAGCANAGVVFWAENLRAIRLADLAFARRHGSRDQTQIAVLGDGYACQIRPAALNITVDTP